MAASPDLAPRYDVIVVGGGHNGLVAAGLLARRGLRVLVVERREVVGGAAITEQPFGPAYRVSTLSYVVSLLPPTVIEELELARHGYKVHPQHPYFVPYPDGRSLMMCDDPARRWAEIARFSIADAAAVERWDAWLAGLAKVVGPLLTAVPPRLGSHQLGDLAAQLGLAWRLRRLDPQGVADLTRLMTTSVADLVEDRFESDAVRAVLAVSGIIGAWAGPRTPGTAYLVLHHQIGNVGDGPIGTWGFPEGGMGAVTEAMRRAALAAGATIATGTAVERIVVRDQRVTGVVLAGGDPVAADVVIATTHPRTTFLDQVGRDHLPDEFATAIAQWKSRSGTVKINLALDRLPEFRSRPGFDPEVHGGTIVLADSLDEMETGFQDAAAGRPSARPFADVCIPSVFDATLAPPGHHVMSLFTQWVPHRYVDEPHRDQLDAYADRVVARLEEVAPGFTASIRHRQVLGPHDLETTYGLVGGNIFHGELSVNQLFHLRPVPGYADYTTPVRGLYQASSATHGGGGVTGIPAVQAVRRVLADLR